MRNPKKIKGVWGVVLMLPLLFGSCNNTDDVQSIFTGRTWRLSYIAQKGKNGMLDPYRFSDVTQTNYNAWDASTGDRSFRIDFDGTTTDNVIAGTFDGFGSVTMTGTFQADGKNNEFLSRVTKSSQSVSSDNYAKKIIEGMKNANSYTGDNNNLYIYFEYQSAQQYDPITLCLVFAPARS